MVILAMSVCNRLQDPPLLHPYQLIAVKDRGDGKTLYTITSTGNIVPINQEGRDPYDVIIKEFDIHPSPDCPTDYNHYCR